MSSLTKILLFFWVFSIVCKLTTSDCIDNLHEIFIESNNPSKNFNVAMSALSENLIDLYFKSVELQNLYNYFQSQSYVVYGFNNSTNIKVHEEVLNYFNYQNVLNSMQEYMSDKQNQDEGSSSSNEGPSSSRPSSSNVESSTTQKQADVLGYFHSFAKKIEDNASMINDNIMSPGQFCDSHTEYDKMMCYHASQLEQDFIEVALEDISDVSNLTWEIDNKTAQPVNSVTVVQPMVVLNDKEPKASSQKLQKLELSQKQNLKRKKTTSKKSYDHNSATNKLADIAEQKLELKKEYYLKKLKLMDEHITTLKNINNILLNKF